MSEPLTREPYDNYVSEERLDIIEENEARRARDLSSLTTMRFRRLFNEIAALHAQLAQAVQSQEQLAANVNMGLLEIRTLKAELAQVTAERDHNSEGWNKSLDIAAKYLGQRDEARARIKELTSQWLPSASDQEESGA